MKRTILACTILAAMGSLAGFQDSNSQTLRELVAMERTSMDGWQKGNSGPALAASDPDITLFHVMTEQRLEGLPAVKALYAAYDGRPLFDSYQIDSPKVQSSGDIAVLTYVLITKNGDTTRKWNSTQVYRHQPSGWKVIHTHFSAQNQQ